MSVLTETLDIVNCDPCDSTEILSQPTTTTTSSTSTTSSTDLQALALASLPPLPDPTCGYRPEETSYQDTLVPEQPLDLGHAFMASQMSDISISMANGMQATPGSEVANSIIERSDTMGEAAYTSTFPAARANSSSFPSAPLPQSSPSFSSLPVPDPSDTSDPQPSIPAIDYPSILSSSPTLPSSTTTSPSLQQTSFAFPTPPPSNSSSPQPLLSSSSSSSSSSSPSANTYHAIPEMISPHAPADPNYPAPASACQSGLQDQISSHPLLTQPSQVLQGGPVTSGNNSPSDQSSAAFIYPNILPTNLDPAPTAAQPLSNQNQPPAHPLPCSLPTHGASTSFSFPSVPPHMQNLSFPNVSPAPAHPALHLPNLSHQAPPPSLAAAFPPSSFAHPPASLPHPPFQPSSCLGVSSSFQQSVSSSAPPLPPTAHPQNLPNPSAASSSSSYPPVELGAIPQFNPPGPYRPEMVLHHPSLLPQLDPSLPSSAPPQALYPAFPSYPLRLCQDPHSSLSIPFRHLYRQHQHGHAHPQGSYLDMSTRPVF